MASAQVQGELWGAAAANWAELQEPTGSPLWRAMLDAADVSDGTWLLDAGCGAGGASLIAAERGAQASGIDASPALIEIARGRLPKGDFRIGDLEALPFEDATFDVVIAANSVQYATDRVRALQELQRVCSPGGHVVLGTWSTPDKCEMRVIFGAVVGTLPAPPPGDGPFGLSSPGALERFLEQAGLRVVTTGDVDAPFDYVDMATFWRAQSSAGPLQGAMREVGEARVRDAVTSAAQSFARDDGTLSNSFRSVSQ